MYRTFRKNQKWFSLAFIFVLLMGLIPMQPIIAEASTADHVVISEVYGGGGNSGATLKNDFIELYNPTSEAVSLDGWSVQYASPTGAFGTTNLTDLSGKTIQPYSYLLIQEAAGTGGTADLPTPDVIGSIGMGGTNGKIVLARTTAAVTGLTDTNVVDYVGYGTATTFEGTGAAGAISSTTSAERKSDANGITDGQGNGYDTNNNNADFSVVTPNPQNSTSSPELPPGTTTPDPVDPNVIPMADAKAGGVGKDVVVQGKVTTAPGALGGKSFYLQDATGGLMAYFSSSNTTTLPEALTIGTTVKVTGKTEEYRGKFEVAPTAVEIIGTNVAEPNAKVITVEELTESVEAQLVKLEGVTITEITTDSFGNTNIKATNGTTIASIKLDSRTGHASTSLTVTVGDVVNVVGVVEDKGTTPASYQVLLRTPNDIALAPVTQEPGVITIAEAKPLTANTEVTLQGVVTHAESSTAMYIQDATSGVQINTNGTGVGLADFVEGEEVKVVGKVSAFNGEIQIKVEVATNITKLGTKALPLPKTITLDQIDAHQGELVKVEMAKLTNVASSSTNFSIEDPAKNTTALYHGRATDFIKTNYQVGEYYNIVGIAAKYNSPQIKLRFGTDMVKQAAPATAKLPIVYNVKPAKMAAVTEVKPAITGKVDQADSSTAIDWASLMLTVDGVDVTAQTTKNETEFTFSYTPASDLALGEHSIKVEVADVAGAKVEYVSYFYIQEVKDDSAYNFYFGVPHAHTGYSDGKGIPSDAFKMAKDNNLDYLIVTDHSNWLEGDEYISDRKEYVEKVGSEWAQTKEQVNTFNAAHSGEFLAMRGFEMTSTPWGHINVTNSQDYVEAKKTVTELGDFYKWLTTEENVVAAFNHPNWPSDSFNDLAYVPEIDHLMAMLEVGNGAPPYSYARAEEHFFRAMDNGWHVGAINGQDNHSANWGVPDNLTAVVAEDLTNESFMEALKQRRVYSTEARDTKLRVKANGFWMGSTLDVQDGSNLNFDIWVQDNDNPIDEIQIITNGGNIVDSVKVGEVTEYTWNPTIVDGSGANWYVVKVIHTDSKWTTASAIYTSGGESDVKLTLLTVNPDPSVPGSETALTATVSNMGVRAVENLEVKFYRGVVSETNYIGTGTIDYIGPGKRGNATTTWIPEASGQDKIIAVLTEIPDVTTVTEITKSIKVVASNGKKVLVDSAHSNADVPGSMNNFMELLRRNGYQAKYNSTAYTAEVLAGYDVLVINAPDKVFTDAEQTAINDWVKAGGSLMLASKSNFSFDNKKLNPLLEKMGSGIRINADNVYEPNTSDKFSGGMKWSVYAYTMPTTTSGLNNNLEAIRYFSGASLVDENLGALTNDPETGLEILVAGNPTSYNFNVETGYHTYNPAIGDESDPAQTSGPDGATIPLIAKEYIGEGRIIVAGRHFYSDYEIVNDVSNTSFTLTAMDWLADYNRIKSIQEVRETAQTGDIVTVKGVVTAPTNKFFDTVYIQDETGGISLYGSQGRDLPVGTVVIATGGITEFEGELELEYENFNMEILYVGPGIEVQARAVTAKQVIDGTFNGQLVELKGTIKEINDADSYMTVYDGQKNARIHTDGYLPLGIERFSVGDYVSVKGIASSGASGNRIRVRFAEDIAISDEAPTTKITILHTNDSHSRVEESTDSIGFAKLSTIVKQYEAQNDNTLLLDAGDTLHGQTFATLTQGKSIVDIMNTMGYDSMAAGNHDFNYGYQRLLELKGMADFPVLSANIIVNATGEYLLPPYVMKEVNGIKVGIFGLSTPETHYKTHPKNVEGLTFTDPVAAAQEMVTELNGLGADVIIALSHLGTDASSTDTSIRVAQGAPGIDVIVDGHSHTVDNINESGTLIVSAGEYTENLGVVELEFVGKELVNKTRNLITKAQTTAIQPDPAVQAVIDAIKAEQQVILNEVVGNTPVKLDGERAQVRAGETNLGNLITNAMLDVTGADLALTNGGGIRASIDVGDITKGEVITVLPFGNYIVTKEIKGADIKAALENGVGDYPTVSGAFPHVAGITFSFDPAKPKGQRVHSVKIKGVSLDLNKMYTLATNDFTAAGGDLYTMFKTYPIKNEFAALDEAVIAYLQKPGTTIPTVEGRIKTEAIPVVTTPPAPTPSNDLPGRVEVDGTTGAATVIIDGSGLASLIAGQSGATIGLDLSKLFNSSNQVSVKLSDTLLKTVAAAKKNVVIQTGKESVEFPIEVLANLASTSGSQITFTIHQTDAKDNSISKVLDLNISIEKDGKKTEYTNFSEPVKVTVSVAGKTITDKRKVAAYYFNEKSSKWEYVGGKLSGENFVFTTNHFSKYAIFENNKTFSDVQNLWAKDAVEVLASRGIIEGVTADTFAPNTDLTRAQFALLLVRALNLPMATSEGKFKDYKSIEIEAAARAGIIYGYTNGTFGPDDKINREQMAAMIIRAIEYKDKTLLQNVKDGAVFKDANQVSSFAKESVSQASALGILYGLNNQTYAPKANTTRAQAAAVIYRLLTALKEIE